MKKFALAGGLGALLAYFLDPTSGARRRNMARDRALAFFRRIGRRSAGMGRGVAAEAYGVSQKATHLKEEPKPQPDDVTLARKVETEIFREADAPKGTVDVNAEDGVVFLRGEVGSEDMIRDLEARTRDVQGVRDVRNLLHVPGAPPPASG